jgi:cytoskeletal protein CcmA (bactofilin family)
MENSKLIFLSEDTDFTGEIEASHIILEGKVKGTVRAKHSIRLKPGSHLEGEAFTERFFPEYGSVYDGKLHILKNDDGADTTTESPKQQNKDSLTGLNKFLTMLGSFW